MEKEKKKKDTTIKFRVNSDTKKEGEVNLKKGGYKGFSHFFSEKLEYVNECNNKKKTV